MTGQQLIERMIAWLTRYVVMTEAQALTVALWALNTWIYDRFPACPYLELWATDKRSGKTTLAEMLAALSRGARVLATVRAVSMARAIEATDGHYTAFLEEAERFWSPTLGDERSILATGYRRGAKHEVTTQKGELLQFRTYAPKAFILIGNVHDILRDRCISIFLSRATPVGNWTADRDAAEVEAHAIIEAWQGIVKRTDVLRGSDERMPVVTPDWLASSRDKELWSPLFSIAHALHLHKETVQLLQRASVDLSVIKTLPAFRYNPAQAVKVNDDQNAAEAVLRDAASVFAPTEDRLRSEELLKRLHAIDTAPWRSWRGTGLDANALATLLARYGLHPKPMRFGKGRANSATFSGYLASDLRKAAAQK